MDGEKDPLLDRCFACGGQVRASPRRGPPPRLLLAAVAALAAAWAVGGVSAELRPTHGGGQYSSLVWVGVGERSAIEGPGCTGVLLSAEWVLLAARCLPDDGTPLTLLAPRGDDAVNASESTSEGSTAAAVPVTEVAGAAGAAGTQQPVAGAGVRRQWSQQRHSVQVVRSPNEDMEKGAAPYPALALVRADTPFALSNKNLQPAQLLWGSLDDPRRPLRCSIAGWDVMGDEGKPGAVYPSSLTWAPIGRVLTYAQCAEREGLVERASQFCVEVAVAGAGVQAAVEAVGALANASEEAARRVQRRGLLGNPLLCAGALAGVRFLRSATPQNDAPRHRIDVFVNATHIEPWIRQHVKDLQVMTVDNGIVLPETGTHTTHVPVRRVNGGHFGRSNGHPPSPVTSVLSLVSLTIAVRGWTRIWTHALQNQL